MPSAASYAQDIANGSIGPEEFHRNKNRRYTFDPFDAPPLFSGADGFSAPSGTTGAVNLLHTPRGVYEWHVLGAGQVITVPAWDRVNGLGLDFKQDLTLSKGHQLSFSPNITGAGQSRGKHSYVIGQDRPFFARLKVRCPDTSGVNPFSFGFFRHQAYQTSTFNYTDYATWEANSNGSGADIKLTMQINGGGVLTAFTPLTWEDNVARVFELRVDMQGVVTWVIDGVVLARPNSVTLQRFPPFDAGDVVRPGTFFKHTSDFADNLFYQEFEAGFLPERAA